MSPNYRFFIAVNFPLTNSSSSHLINHFHSYTVGNFLVLFQHIAKKDLMFSTSPWILNEDIREPAKSLCAEHGNIKQFVSLPESQREANGSWRKVFCWPKGKMSTSGSHIPVPKTELSYLCICVYMYSRISIISYS